MPIDSGRVAEETVNKFITDCHNGSGFLRIDDYISEALDLAYKQGREEMREEVNPVITASKNFVEFYKKHCAFEEEKTKRFQEAANIAREGNQREARRIVQGYDDVCMVFDYSAVNKGLVEAIAKLDASQVKEGV